MEQDEKQRKINALNAKNAPRYTAFLGIDVGLEGGFAVIPHRGPGVAVYDAPIVVVDGKNHYDVPGIVRLLRPYQGDTTVIVGLEKQQSMPKQGVASSFKLGDGYGLWRGILTALEIPFEPVHPKTWQKVMLFGKRGKDKGAAILKAHELFPAVDVGKKDGRAEALLIAEYMRYKFR